MMCAVGTYSLQLFTETLKALRKQTAPSAEAADRRCLCLTVLLSSWTDILHLFLHELRERPRKEVKKMDDTLTKWTNQSLTEFFSLTLEILRVQDYHCGSNPITKCHLKITSSISNLSALTKSSESMFLLKKFCDILLKLIDKDHLCLEATKHLAKCLLEQASSETFQLAWKEYITKHSLLYEAANDQGLTLDNGLMNTVMRKVALVLLKYVHSSVHLSLTSMHLSF